MAHLFLIDSAPPGATSAVELTDAPDGKNVSLPWDSPLPWDSAPRLSTAWKAVTLESDCYGLDADGDCLRLVAFAQTSADGAPPFLLVRSCEEDERGRWLLLGPPGDTLRINGSPLALGARVLHHRDELRAAGVPGRAFFSLEELCRIAPFEGPEGAVCPRCQLVIPLGTPSVRCAQCRTCYHETDERPCWTYTPHCQLDDQPTALDAGYRFHPEEVLGV